MFTLRDGDTDRGVPMSDTRHCKVNMGLVRKINKCANTSLVTIFAWCGSNSMRMKLVGLIGNRVNSAQNSQSADGTRTEPEPRPLSHSHTDWLTDWVWRSARRFEIVYLPTFPKSGQTSKGKQPTIGEQTNLDIRSRYDYVHRWKRVLLPGLLYRNKHYTPPPEHLPSWMARHTLHPGASTHPLGARLASARDHSCNVDGVGRVCGELPDNSVIVGLA